MFLVSLLALAQVCASFPAAEEVTLPEENKASPYEVNNLHLQKKSLPPESTTVKVEHLESIILEVEKILATNPTLPRLTRGEIIDIIENITKEDLEEAYKAKNRDPKALMLVLPFTPNNTNESNIQEFYTKAPITHIVGGDSKQSGQDRKKTVRRKPVRPKPTEQSLKKLQEIERAENQKRIDENEKYINENKVQTDLENQTKITEATTKSSQSTHISRIPQRRRKHPEATTRKQQVTTESTLSEIDEVTKQLIRKRPTFKPVGNHPNHRYPGEQILTTTQKSETLSGEGIRIVSPPKFLPQPQNQFVGETAHPKEHHSEHQTLSIININDFLANQSPKLTTGKPILQDLSIPDDLRNAVKDIDLLMNDSSNKYSSQYDASTTQFQKQKPQKENVKEILSSIRAGTTSTAVPDVSNVADNLSPDMQDLLMRFGLIPDPNKKPPVEEPVSSFTPEVIPIQPDSYVNFKPLPDTQPAGDDMVEFLAQFGLTGNTKRGQKALKSSDEKNKIKGEKTDIKNEKNKNVKPTTEKANTDNNNSAPIEEFSQVNIDNIREEENVIKNDEDGFKTEESKIIENHIFNPTDVPGATPEELEKLNKLMEVIKELEKLNGTATEEDLKHIDIEGLKELVASLHQEKDIPLDQQIAPDPMNYDFGVSKNEVKRQSSSTSTTTTSTTTTTTEEPKNANLEALAESFGGAPSTTTAPPETTPARSRSGFYYLLDWNSFLEVDNQKGKRVNLRFQPKVGDPSRFYSVSVP